MEETVTLLGKQYQDVTDNQVVSPVRAYIQCSWFSPEETQFMEDGLTALGRNQTVSLKYSHHPLNHPYKGIDVNAHPEVMEQLEWQQNTFQSDVQGIYGCDLGIGLFMPSKPDVGQAYEQGVLYALHKPNVVVVPDSEIKIPLNLMVSCGNTQVIPLSDLATFNFHEVSFLPHSGKVF